LLVDFSVQFVLVRLVHARAQCRETLLRARDLGGAFRFHTALVGCH
jgi:hypothetical protein